MLAPLLSFPQDAGIRVAPSEAAIQQYELPFQVNKVSEEDLRQFEAKALQKVEDFDGYLKIISDSSYDGEMREYAIELALNGFEDPEALFIEKESQYPISDLLKNLMEVDKTGMMMRMKNVKLINPYHWDAKRNLYMGKIAGNLMLQLAGSSAKIFELEIFLTKTEKYFGNETKEVWEVFLGDIVVE